MLYASVRSNVRLGGIKWAERSFTSHSFGRSLSPVHLRRKSARFTILLHLISDRRACSDDTEGAGITTSCGIPDFRGPSGVWTLQNVDSLHLCSGIPGEKLAELHGNSFREICASCDLESRLKDTVLDWDDALPPTEMNPAEQYCRMADVVLCLSTSLQITPACNLPLKSLRNGGTVILFWKDIEHHRARLCWIAMHRMPDKFLCYSVSCDNLFLLHLRKFLSARNTVIAGVIRHLNLWIPPYVRVDPSHISLDQFYRPTRSDKYVKWALSVESVHGPKAPLPFIKSVEVYFSDKPDLKTAILHKQPLKLKRETLKTRPFTMALKLNFSNGCGCQCANIESPVNFLEEADSFSHSKDDVVHNLRNGAI